MSNEAAINTLNRLLDAEHASFAQRLGEASPFVDDSQTAAGALVDRMVAATQDHQHQLSETILALRGAPALRRRMGDSGSMHYLELSFLLPKAIAAQRDLIRVYESAGRTGDSTADELIGRILATHQAHLAELEALRAGTDATEAQGPA
jgi:bacterioferritin (cytochrome b1)